MRDIKKSVKMGMFKYRLRCGEGHFIVVSGTRFNIIPDYRG